MITTTATLAAYVLLQLQVSLSLSLDPRHLICSKGFFACNSSDLCVEQKKQCDFHEDCADGSDEWNCEDKHEKKFWDGVFKKRPDEDFEKKLDNCQLDRKLYPSQCICSSSTLHCQNGKFTRVPRLLPPNVTTLDLSGNNIRRLEEDDFKKVRKLRFLIIGNSKLVDIDCNAFKELEKLRTLYLVGNELRTLRNKTFVENDKLLELDLRHNSLTHLEVLAFKNLKDLQYLDLSFNKLRILSKTIFDDLEDLETLQLSNNLLEKVVPGVFNPLDKLKRLYLNKNRIHFVVPNSFFGMDDLQELMLSVNQITVIRSGTFANLTQLQMLSLSENQIHTLEKDTFQPLIELKTLNLKKNHGLRKIPHRMFEHLISLTHIYFDEFWMCAHAMHVRVCEPKGDGISSLENLLDSTILRVCVWVVAVLACIGNTCVLIGRILMKEPNQVHSFYIKNLSVADFFMGVYLFIIASYDVTYRGSYIRHDADWRASWQCDVCGILSTISSEASVFILTVITFDRYSSVIHPLAQKRHTLCCASFCMLFLWILAAAVALVPMFGLSYFGDEFYGNNGVCLPLHIHDPFDQAWEYSAAIFVGVNLLAFAFIAFAYIRMFMVIQDSRVALRSTQETQDRVIAQRFAFIVCTDFACWMPIIIIKVLALTGTTIHEELYAWLAIFIIPVNSALNPILYTLTTKVFSKKIHRIFSLFKPKSQRGFETSGLYLSSVLFNRTSKKNLNHDITTNSTTGGRLSIKSVMSIAEVKQPSHQLHKVDKLPDLAATPV